MNELPGGLDLRRHVGEHELDRLERQHRLAELLPLRGVAHRPVEGALGQADGLRRDTGTRAVERHHRVLEADAFLRGHPGGSRCGHAAVVKCSSTTGTQRMPIVSSRLPIFGSPGVSRSTTNAEIPRGPAVGIAVEAKMVKNVGHAAVRVPLLLAVDDPVVAVLGRGAEAPGVGARGLLGETEGDQALALGDARKVLLLLLLGAAEDDRERTERVDRVGHADAAAGTRQLLDHHAEVQDAGAVAAVLLRDPQSRSARRT